MGQMWEDDISTTWGDRKKAVRVTKDDGVGVGCRQVTSGNVAAEGVRRWDWSSCVCVVGGNSVSVLINVTMSD